MCRQIIKLSKSTEERTIQFSLNLLLVSCLRSEFSRLQKPDSDYQISSFIGGAFASGLDS
jgi:hypothetical protein